MIDRATVDRIIDAAEIVDVVGDFVTLHRRGQNYLGLCPFHEDRRPSFTVSPAKNICKCFACGEGGTPLNFLMKHEHLSYTEALRYLAQKYGIPIVEKEETEEEKHRRSNREMLFHANAFARDLYAKSLLEQEEGRLIGLSYFKERSFTMETIKAFQLGYAPMARDFLSSQAPTQGHSLTALETLGLVSKGEGDRYYDRFRERVIFPIHSLSGNIVGFGGRILKKSDKLAKYINSPESEIYNKRRELYGLYFSKSHISKLDKCLIVEGYTDVLSFHQSGIGNVVASSGTALTVEQVRLIKRFTNQVTLLFDSDAAGIKAAMRGIDILLAQDMEVKVVLLPDGHDPDSFAKSHSPEEIKAYIEMHEVDFIRFKIDLLEREGGSSPSSRAHVVASVVDSLAYINEDLTREVYVKDSATLLNVSEEAIFSKVDAIRRDRQQNEHLEAQRQREREYGEVATSTPSTPIPEEPVSVPVTTPPFVLAASPSQILLEMPLATHLLQHGESIAVEEADEVYTVAELLISEVEEVRANGDLSPLFVKFIDAYQAGKRTQSDFSPERYLTAHPDDEVRALANKILLSDVQLSSLHRAFEEEQTQPESLTKAVMIDLLSLKYTILEKLIVHELARIKEISTLPDTPQKSADIVALSQRIQELNTTKQQMAKMLGDRVLTLKTRIN